MSFKKLQEFIEMAKSAGVQNLAYKDGDKEFSIGFPGQDQPMNSRPVTYKDNESMGPEVVVQTSNLIDITSPFVGTYYSAGAPTSPAYVKLGDKISEGNVLCIVEAMKIMNEIEADANGEIVEICVENENYVEFGQVLFKIKPL